MCIGLKRTTVALEEHNIEWEHIAARTISELKEMLGDVAVDIQHVGSTSIQGIVAKPIIDIAVGVSRLEDMFPRNHELEKHGFVYRRQDIAGQLLYVVGDFQEDIRTHHIHVVIHNGTAWNNYINFRDYLNQDRAMAAEYSQLKKNLCNEYASNRNEYTAGKRDLIEKILLLASAWKRSN